METLNESVSQELINKYRDINVDFDNWYDFVYESFTEDMNAIGIEVDNIYFTGFWSQGDGACFEGSVNDKELFLKNFEGYPMIKTLLKYGGTYYLSCKHRGHYSHYNCTYFTLEYDNISLVLPNNSEFQTQVSMAMDQKLEEEMEDFEEEAVEFMRDKMKELYSRLNDEYDYQTSDEAVTEAIISNDLHIEE